MTVENICRRFGIKGTLSEIITIKSGHINDTFKITFRDGEKDDIYIVQQINTFVFPDPFVMMDNILKVTSHIEKKLGDNSERGVLRFLKTQDGASCFYDDENKCWRAYRFIDNSVTYDLSDNLDVLKATGTAFGRFQNQLADFDASSITETLPDFHDTEKRLNKLFEDAAADPLGRAKDAEEELNFFREIFDSAVKLTKMHKEGLIPARVTHNDTKCNNVLFDEDTHEPLAVIDLDTVMPGLALHDFGDAIRFAANAASEDEADFSKVALSIDKFRAFTEGFLNEVGNTLSPLEIENLVHGAFVITIELSSRFLDDYIMGDKYFKIDFPGHNLLRTRSQLALAKDILKKYDLLNEIVSEIYGG